MAAKKQLSKIRKGPIKEKDFREINERTKVWS